MSERPLAAAISGRGIVAPDEAAVACDDEGFARGRAAFETLRVYDGVPFRLDRHVERLVQSAARLGLPAPEPDAVRQLARIALDSARDHKGDRTLRLYWTPGASGQGPRAVALVSAVPDWIEPARERGQRLVSLPFPARSMPWLLPGTKSVSYATHVAAEAEAKRRGADDAVLVDLDGTVLEGPVTNVWWREGGRLLTPSLELGILAGETRAALLELAAELGYETEEGGYGLERLLGADEAFTSSSVREVMPVVAVDDRAYASREAADALQQALRRAATS
jgi:branched-subunit amino acid aminotransferase/4-amino-4-deoxychorismate lyase